MGAEIPFLRARGKGGVAARARAAGPMARGAAVLLALFCSAAGRAEPFLDVAGGAAFTHPTDIRIDRPNEQLRYTNVPVQTRSFDSPPHYLIRAGYFFEGERSMGVCLSLLHLKYFPRREVEVNEGRMDERFDRFSITHGYNHFPLELILRFPMKDFHPYVSGGPSLLVLHPEIVYRDEGGPTPRYLYGGIGLNAAVGARLFFTRWLGVVGEYRVSASNGAFNLAGDRYQVTERSHVLHLGVTVRPPS